MASPKGLNPYAAEFVYPPFSYCYYFSNIQTSSTWVLSAAPAAYSLPFPTDFPYPTLFEHHVFPVALQTVPEHQPELVEVEQQIHEPLANEGDEATQMVVTPRAPRVRGSKVGFRRYSRFFDQKTTSTQQLDWKPALKSTDKKIPRRFVDYNWRMQRRMVKRFSDVLPVRKDGEGTTVMIRNIPNKYSRDLLVAFLDNHCAKENGKSNKGEESKSAFDFLYLPMDFWTGMNKGYAFVNFTDPVAVWKFFLAVDNQTWDSFQSNKIRKIAYARIQGKEDLVQHFQTMGFPCESEEVLPVCFNPPRDGSEQVVENKYIGKLEGWAGIGLKGQQATGTWRKVKYSD